MLQGMLGWRNGASRCLRCISVPGKVPEEAHLVDPNCCWVCFIPLNTRQKVIHGMISWSVDCSGVPSFNLRRGRAADQPTCILVRRNQYIQQKLVWVDSCFRSIARIAD